MRDFRAPGTPCWTHVPKAKRRGHISVPHALPGRCLGLSKTGKGWTILLDSGKIVSSSNVVFWEDDDDDVAATPRSASAALPPESAFQPELKDEPATPPPALLDDNPFALLKDDDSGDSDADEPDDSFITPPASPQPAPRAAPPPPHKPAPPRRSTRLNPPPAAPAPAPPQPTRRSARLAGPTGGLSGPELDAALAPPDEDEAPVAPPPAAPAAPSAEALRARVWRTKVVDTATTRGGLIPRGRRAAMASDASTKWAAAERKEIATLREKQVYELVPRPMGGEAVISAHFVYDMKRGPTGELQIGADGTPDGQKARLVANGNEQDPADIREGSYAPTAAQESVRLILGEAAQPGFELFSADVKGAYLEAELPYPVYIRIPESDDAELEAARRAGQVMLLRKCLYGLVESGYFWSKLLREQLLGMGFHCCDADRGLYVLRRGTSVL